MVSEVGYSSQCYFDDTHLEPTLHVEICVHGKVGLIGHNKLPSVDGWAEGWVGDRAWVESK